MVGTRCRASGGAAAPPYQSIDEDENGGVLGGFDDILKLPVSRHRRFELGGNGGDGFEEAQQQTALDRVIQLVAVRKDSGNAPLAASAPPELPGCTGTLI